jgi:hypothetical protein
MKPRLPNLGDRYQRPYRMPRPAPAAVTGAIDRAPATKPRRQRSRAGSRPNAAIEALYRKRLERLVTEMADSVLYWMRAAYRQNEPVMAQDGPVAQSEEQSPSKIQVAGSSPAGSAKRNMKAVYGMDGEGNGKSDPDVDRRISGGRRDHDLHLAFDRTPADHLRAAFARLRKRWEKRFDVASGKLARWFAQSSATRSDAVLKRILKDGGLSVRFTPTKAMRDVMEGTVQANVALIKSIPSQYLTQVEGMVMRSVQTGRDLHQLSSDLRRELGVTKRRAATIALNQNNAATSAMTRARQVELGVQSIWVHSHAGKEPRPTHLANDGQPYDPAIGWFDTDPKVRRRIWPGELINCRCFARSVIKGFKP